MAWARIDDGMPEHPKVVKVSPMAELVAYRAICYANRFLTDGFIPTGALSGLTSRLDHDAPRLAEQLVGAGLWHKRRGGFLIHDFLDWNLSRAQVEANREHARKGGRKSAEIRASGRLSGSSTDAQAISHPLRTTKPPTRARVRAGLRQGQGITRGTTRGVRATRGPDRISSSEGSSGGEGDPRGEREAVAVSSGNGHRGGPLAATLDSLMARLAARGRGAEHVPRAAELVSSPPGEGGG